MVRTASETADIVWIYPIQGRFIHVPEIDTEQIDFRLK